LPFFLVCIFQASCLKISNCSCLTRPVLHRPPNPNSRVHGRGGDCHQQPHRGLEQVRHAARGMCVYMHVLVCAFNLCVDTFLYACAHLSACCARALKCLFALSVRRLSVFMSLVTCHLCFGLGLTVSRIKYPLPASYTQYLLVQLTFQSFSLMPHASFLANYQISKLCFTGNEQVCFK